MNHRDRIYSKYCNARILSLATCSAETECSYAFSANVMVYETRGAKSVI